MKALVLGTGMQGKAVLYDLAKSSAVTHIVAADRDVEALTRHVKERQYRNVTCERLDAADTASLERLMKSGVNVVLDLLPPRYIPAVAASAVKFGVHVVNTFYVPDGLADLAAEARSRNVTILPEFGLDPGIDLVMLGEAFRGLDEVREVRTYGAGIPDVDAHDNPLDYKISWTFEGVLSFYKRAARVIRDGQTVQIGDTEVFAPENVHRIEVDGLGPLEAFPNEDALTYAEYLPDASSLKHMGRYTARWPGHSAFWKKLVDLHFLDEATVMVEGHPVNPRQFLRALLEPQLQYREGERDVAFLRVDVRGLKNGREEGIVFELIDRKDLDTGLSAMNRTVGFTASIGAQMILEGVISKRGLLSPVRDVPWEPLRDALAERGVTVTVERRS